jgi:hypothetical protein
LNVANHLSKTPGFDKAWPIGLLDDMGSIGSSRLSNYPLWELKYRESELTRVCLYAYLQKVSNCMQKLVS